MELYGTSTVSLVKSGDSDFRDKEHFLTIVGSWTIDYMTAKLTNKDLLRVIGKAYFLGYTDFSVYVSIIPGQEVKVLEVDQNGHLTVNWDVVRKVTTAEWNA